MCDGLVAPSALSVVQGAVGVYGWVLECHSPGYQVHLQFGQAGPPEWAGDGELSSAKLVHLSSAKLVHSSSAKLVHLQRSKTG